MKILILAMAHETDDVFFSNCKTMWLQYVESVKSEFPDVSFKLLYSDPSISNDYEIENHKIIVKTEENYWEALLHKTFAGFKYFSQKKFDLVFKISLSTIVNFPVFISYCRSNIKNRKFVYDGCVGHYGGYKFCSGAGMLLNKDSVDLVLSEESKISNSWTDDIFIGYVLNKINKIEPNQGDLKRLDILRHDQKINKKDILDSSHMRIKTSDSIANLKFLKLAYHYLVKSIE